MQLAEIFTDNMLLQRRKNIAVFGSGQGKGRIEFCGKVTEFESTEERFTVYLPSEEAGGPYDMTVTLDGETTVYKNVMIGDVYIAAGQSNMEMVLRRIVDIENIPSDNIRLFTEPHNTNDDMTEFYHREPQWKLCTVEAMQEFTAIGYGVASLLHQEVGVPIGVISLNKGASRVDAWTDPTVVETPAYQKWIETKHADYDLCIYNQKNWLFLNKVAPIIPYTVNGVLWYQGESNRLRDEAVYYDKMLTAMIENWRDLWQDKLPFYVVQLMPFVEDPQNNAAWEIIRQKQELVAKTVDGVHLATLVNTGEHGNIHPAHKFLIARQVANAILNSLYGYNTIPCGPILESAEKKGTEIVLTFAHSEGLHIKGDTLEDVFVYDADGAEYPADCRIEGETLVITTAVDVKAVAMGWRNNPTHNLYNAADFLASPFKVNV